MSWDFEHIRTTAEEEIRSSQNEKDLEALRVKYLGRKGLVSEIYASLSALSAGEKPQVGKFANEFKNSLTRLMDERRRQLESLQKDSPGEFIDVTMPGIPKKLGRRHIISQTINEICAIFERLGFSVTEGPEIETEFNNFTALNIPVDHPSRDAFDTFYLETVQRTAYSVQRGDKVRSTEDAVRLLRSHTSPAQIR